MIQSYSPIPEAIKIHNRSGFTTPAVAVALLVVMMGLAMVIDRTWLETAKLELTSAAESAALAAAAELASDNRLMVINSVDLRSNNGRQVGAWIAAQNFVGGSPVILNTDSNGDIRFGNLVQESQGIQFVESDVDPNTVVVTALRTRSNNNPVALFIGGAFGFPVADVAVRTEATVNNDVMGLRPITGSPIAALPIAIWETDPSGQRADTWANMITARGGSDQYSFDSETHSVIAVADGIPEMVIQISSANASATTSNVQLVDLGTGLTDTETSRQFETGITVDDLQNFGGNILVGQGATINLTASTQFSSALLTDFQSLIGGRRICFLYSTVPTQQPPAAGTISCTEIVAIRVMAVQTQSNGSSVVTIQPTVMTCRNAMLVSELSSMSTSANSSADPLSTNVADQLANEVVTSQVNSQSMSITNPVPNPYVFKLRITQ